MNYTEYYNIPKPEETEKYNINIYNETMDIIDNELKRLNGLSIEGNQYATKEELNELSNIIGQANILLETI